MSAKSSSSIADALNYMAQWLPAESNAIGVLAGVNKEFNEVFQEEATEIGDERQYRALKAYISDDLQHSHGFFMDPGSMDEEEAPMQMFILNDEEEEDVIVYIFRGPGSSVMFTSKILDWQHVQINSTEEWADFSPWASLSELVNLDMDC